jgi:predicted nucleic acid-binding protein
VPPARTLVFLDASALVAASHSPSGGSAVAIEVCQGIRFRAAVTNLVLLEARNNIAKKFGAEELVRFYRQLAAMQPEIAPAPPVDRLKECAPLTSEKDAHVLAAALECRAGYLLTLDWRHLLTPAVQAAGLPMEVMTPGDFLRLIVAERSK